MANTLEKLFPFSTLKTNAATICPVYKEFSAPIIAGQYVFSESTTPAVEIGTLSQGQKGLLPGFKFRRTARRMISRRV